MSKAWSQFFERSQEIRTEHNQVRSRGGLSFGGDAQSLRLDFGTNDYLGLASTTHDEVPLADEDSSGLDSNSGLTNARFGSGASPVLSGYTATHQAVEQLLCELCGADDALVFSSGYGCNVGVLSALLGPGDLVLSDALNHASLIDGVRLSKAAKFIYEHNQIDQAKNYLEGHRHEFEKAILVTESVFSMDGDTANLEALSEICEQYDCGLVVDEAHGLGIFGESGGGLAEELRIHNRLLAKLGTLSKAAGSIGGYVCGSQNLIEYLVNHCRSYIFSTAPPLPVMERTHQNLHRLKTMHQARQQLRSVSVSLREQLRQLGWDVPVGCSPIVPILVGSEEAVLRLSRKLFKAGILVPAIRPPTVPAGACRLRVSLTCNHSAQDIQALVTALEGAKLNQTN